ncbi:MULTISPECIES: helix-turn-helix domain-containing protein [unclassified Nocardioides]|uniref:helix-turn-helix domain-containing protein n=1 Tax=unclassified Nocardioides TaxID=2615069 RepID=UPI001885BF25|nr:MULTISPECIES: helix-turn-helix domain-containing protein [unclassified Nocardioides]
METNTHPRPLTTTAADTLLLTLDEAARQLCCARRSVERHVANHRLRVVHLGRSVRVERRELERFIVQMRDQDAEVRDE